MGYFSKIMVENNIEWNKIVRSFSNYDVFYLNEYVKSFMKEDAKNGIPVLLLYDNGQDRAINIIFHRDVARDEKFFGKIPENTYFDLASPYGYGGFWGNILDYSVLNREYNKYCLENKYVCEFVRFDLFSPYYKYYDGEIETRTHNVIRNLDIPIDDIWMNFKSKVRKNVKRAIKNNLRIIIENSGEYLQSFLDIYYSTMTRCDAENEYFFSKSFFEELNTMQDNIMYFHTVFEGKIISTELVIYGAETCYSYLGGTNKEYFEMRPNDFLKYEIIKWAKGKGLKYFVLGGGYGADDGIFQYKTCLAPDGIVDFYIGRKIFNSERYQKLVDLRVVDNPTCKASGYFPKYRT